ncbi:hypothetical protein [Cellulomonas sp. NPDC089187]|uniref:hypothetical protein n=1 Tax=Cellulomonas sp. NPDC089187 TaxID=3154970 RepID=UPI003449A14B
MHPTSTFDLILLDHADRLDAVRARRDATRPGRDPHPDRPPEPRPNWAWSVALLPATLVGAVAR